jgi:hypothetical protein
MATSTRTFDLATIERFRKGIQSDYGKYNDPTYLGFVFLFNDFDPNVSPLLARGTDSAPPPVGSALSYLASINDTARYNYLKLFQELLLDTNYWMPWYWQQIDGIDKIWDYGGLKDPYKGGDDSRLKVTTLESIDLRITALMDLYRKACYDYTYRRFILPDNLRKFQVSIFIQEIRNIQVDFGALGNAINTVNQLSGAYPQLSPLNIPVETPKQRAARETAQVSNEFGANMMFTLKYCEFDADKSFGSFASVNNSAPEPASQVIEFTYDSIDESYLNPTVVNTPPGYSTAGMNYSFLGDLPAPPTSAGEGMLQKLEKLASDPDYREDIMKSAAKNAGAALGAAAANAVDTLATNAANRVQGELNRLLLGNVYGFSPSQVLTSLQQGSLLSLGPQAQNIAENRRRNNSDNAPINLGNYYK